jgi:hypothetical protein
MGVARFERFFRSAASLNVHKNDLKRYSDFVDEQIYDLLVRGEATAKANNRDVIESYDLPITKGLQESVHEFERIDEEIELAPILEALAGLPQLDRAYSDETETRLPIIVGGLSVALGRTLKLIDPDRRTPRSEDWERAFRIFDLLL